MPQVVPVPSYVSANAKRGLELHEEGHSGEGLKPQTVREARDMVEGSISEDKLRRMGPWLRRHEADLDAPKNKDPKAPGYPGAGLVAWLLWGGDANGDMRAAEWAEKKAAQLDKDEGQNAAGLTEGGKPMEAETIEAKHLAAVEQINTLTAKVSEVEALLTEAANAVKVAEEARNAALSEKETLAANLADALAKVEKLEEAAKPVEAQAAAIVASCKADPANVSPAADAAASAPVSVIEQLNALPVGSKARADFFNANKKAIWAARNAGL